MTLCSWIRDLINRPATRPIRKATRRTRLAVEGLEDRAVPAAFFPATVNDLILGIVTANVNGEDDVIDLGGLTFTLTAVNNTSGGSNGLPVVLADGGHLLTFEGNGGAIERSTAIGTPDFRILAISSGASATLSGLTIAGGRVDFGAGVSNGGTLTLNDCTIQDNTGTIGGGGISNNDGATLTAADCTFSGNFGANYGGGGILNGIGTASLTNCTFSGNTSDTGGGGIDTHGTLTATNCTFSGNTLTAPGNYGGAGILTTGTTTLTNCTISGNSTPTSGGGVFMSGGTTTLTNCTISGNSAASGGGIVRTAGILSIGNTIVAGNTGGDASGTMNSQGNNLIGTNGGAGWVASDLTGTIAVPLNPLLSPLGDYGGPTQTMLPLVQSVAINAGNGGLIPAGITTDQRGLFRIVGGAVDIGAVERQDSDPLPATFIVLNTNDNGPGSLRDAITQAQSGLNLTIPNAIVFNDGTSPGTNFYDATPDVITLTSGQLTLTDAAATTIDGPGAKLLSITANNASRVFAINSGAFAFLEGLTITGGTADFGAGVNNSGSLSLNNCTIKDNTGTTGGGGISNNNGAMLTAAGSTFSGNFGANYGGGGILNGIGWVELYNCTFSGNTSDTGGGGIDSHGTLTATNCTFSGNTLTAPANYGGAGILTDGATTLRSTIVAGNLLLGVPDDIHGTVDAASSYNLIGVGGSGGLTNGVNFNLVGPDPLLAPLGNNGGTTPTMALSPASPAINSGNNPLGLSFDQRGALRTFGGQTDIGAFEFIPTNRVVDVTTDIDNGNYAVGDLSLREALELANVNPGEDTISFDPTVFSAPQTITLTGDELTLTDAATTRITGPGASLLSISGSSLTPSNTSRAFNINSGASAVLSGLTITQCTILSGNVGVGLFNAGTVTLNDCTVSGNTGGTGGIGNLFGTMTVNNCILTGNNVGVFSRGDLAMTDSTISGNTGNNGAGVYTTGGTLVLTNCTVSGNSAGGSAGGLNIRSTAGTLINCTVTGNSCADGSGGGVNTSAFGSATLINCTITGNIAGVGGSGAGGGISNGGSGTFTVSNTIIAGNLATTTGPDVSAAVTSQGNNLVGNADGSTGWVGSDLTGTTAAPLDPLLAPLGNNGGPTQTMALSPASGAINAGNNALIPAGVTTDQRGLARIALGDVDIGAFELQQVVAPTFSALTSQSIVYGTPTATLTGHLGFGTDYPTGSSVTITLNSVTQTATVDGSGNFTTTFNTLGLGVAGGPYTVTYSFAGTAGFASATDTSTSVTVAKANATFTVTVYSVTYDGTPHTAAVSTITGVNGETGVIVGAVDVSSTTHIDAGTYGDSWSFTGGANYNDSASTAITDTIAKAASVTVVTINGGPFPYTGLAQTPATVAVTGAGGLSLTPAASYVNNVSVGTATATYTFAGDANHTGSADSKTFTIDRIHLTAVGSPIGDAPQVTVRNADGSVRFTFFAYDSAFRGGVTVATGDVTGDGVDDIITGAGIGGAPHVKVFDGMTGAELASFYAFDFSFRGGVSVGAADLSADGVADIVAGAGPGGAPHVKAFRFPGLTEVASFFAFESAFRGGVNVATGDVTGDGQPDLVLGAGIGGGPVVRVFDGDTGLEVSAFFAGPQDDRGGARVAVADLDGDGTGDLVARVGGVSRVFDPLTGADRTAEFSADDLSGVFVA